MYSIRMHRRIEDLTPRLTGCFCPIHGDLHISQHFLRSTIRPTTQDGTDTDRHDYLLTPHDKRDREFFLDSPANSYCIAWVNNVFKQHSKFVSSKSRDSVVVRHLAGVSSHNRARKTIGFA